MEDPAEVLAMSQVRGEALDFDVTLTEAGAAEMRLDGLWYRMRTSSKDPKAVTLQRLGEIGHVLDSLAPHLEFAAVAACDPQGRLVAISGTARNLLGFAANGPLLGRTLTEILGLKVCLADRQAGRYFIEIPVDRRESINLEVCTEPYLDLTARASGWLVTFSSKPFLAPTVVHWQSLVEHFPGIVIRLDRSGHVVFANRRVGSFTVEELQGRGVFEFVRSDSRITAKHFRDLVVHQKTSLTGELPIFDERTKETIWYSFNAAPVLRGPDVEILIYATDISLRKQAEEELQASQIRISSLVSRLDQAQEQERRRISRELHDELGGMLTALRLEVDALGNMSELPSPAYAKLEGVCDMLTSTLTTVRRLSTQLRPPILDDLGLAAALESLLKDAGRRSGFDFDFEAPSPVPGDLDLHLHLYRICQEAVTNVCRHARATHVKVSLTHSAQNRLDLQIQDNGRGFSSNQQPSGRTLGLSGIMERLELLGGKVEILGRMGKGCRLRAEIPLIPDDKDFRTNQVDP